MRELISEVIERLSHELTQLHADLSHVFYAGDGASAVEVAIKMAVHAQTLRQGPGRGKVACLENSYHGETALTMSLSDCELDKKPYADLLLEMPIIKNVPYVTATSDPLWHDCSAIWPKTGPAKYMPKNWQ